jgi:hypothetical protein
MIKTEKLTDIMLSLELISILELSEVESTMNLQLRKIFHDTTNATITKYCLPNLCPCCK